MDPAITAAIIGAVVTTTEAAVAAGVASKEPGDGGMTAAIENESFIGWNLWKTAVENHGMWKEPPSKDLDPVPTPQVLFDAWKISSDGPSAAKSITTVDDLPPDLSILFQDWIGKLDIFKHKELVDQCVVEGHGAGSQVIWLYKSTDNSVALACMLSNRPDQGFKAGCSMTSVAWMTAQIERDDNNYSDLIDHIFNADTDKTALSTGDRKVVSWGMYECAFTAAKAPTKFKITGGSST